MKLFLLSGLLFIINSCFASPLERIPLTQDDAEYTSILINCLDETKSIGEAAQCVKCFMDVDGSEDQEQEFQKTKECFNRFYKKGAQECPKFVQLLDQGADNANFDDEIWEETICLNRGIYHRTMKQCFDFEALKKIELPMEAQVRNIRKCAQDRLLDTGFKIEKLKKTLEDLGKDYVREPSLDKDQIKDLKKQVKRYEIGIHCKLSSNNTDDCLECFSKIPDNGGKPDSIVFFQVAKCTGQNLGKKYDKCFDNKKLIRNLNNNEHIHEIFLGCFEGTLDDYIQDDCVEDKPSVLTNDALESYYNVHDCITDTRTELFQKSFPQEVRNTLKFATEFHSKVFTRPN